MKNLYQLLKPQVKKRLLSERNQYSIVDTDIIPLLKSKYIYTDLTISQVNRLIVFSNTSHYDWSVSDFRWGTKLFNEDKK
jgi:RES domain-containing protein